MPEDEGYAQQDLSTENDVLWLEDHVSRIQLEVSGEYLAKLSTGFVVGVRGSYTSKGHFKVKDLCLAQNLISSPLPPAAAMDSNASGSFALFLSGLFIGAQDENVEARNRLVDFLLGKDAQLIKRVIVCGGVYAVPTLGQVPPGLADADNMFAQLSEKLTIDVLPGRKDPTNLCMPQMPLHPYFFKAAKKTGNFKSVTNPYQCTLDDLNFVGHSGQPVEDLLRCTSLPTPLAALTASLDACLLAPTAPDTLGTQPYAEADPFVIEKTPQVLFSGGHAKVEFDWRSSSSDGPGTLCVCVPAFSSQPSAVLVNLNNPKDVRVQHFGTQAA
jgi:DNA polymerase delta subunit 2